MIATNHSGGYVKLAWTAKRYDGDWYLECPAMGAERFARVGVLDLHVAAAASRSGDDTDTPTVPGAS